MYTKTDATTGGRKAANLDSGHPLLQWMQACDEFCAVRNQIKSLIKQRLANRNKETEKQQFVSQCPTRQLIELELGMTSELEWLLNDINGREGNSFFDKIAQHVIVLQTWKQRAEQLVRLAARSAD